MPDNFTRQREPLRAQRAKNLSPLTQHLHKSSLSKEHMVALPYQAFLLSAVNRIVLLVEC